MRRASGLYQQDDCGTNNVDNGLGSPAALGCPSGDGAPYGRIKAPEGGMCGADQRLCRSPPGTGFAFGGMYQVSDCDHRLDVGNPVRGDGAAACPAGMLPVQTGRIKEPEGARCGANQFACW
jgi:hypothetical protein